MLLVIIWVSRDASTSLCFLDKCLFMFRFALKTSLHSGHLTFSWSCWCFLCWWWLRKDLGFCWHAPTKHIQRPGLSSVLCILLLWSFMYAFELVLYLHSWESVQESAWFPVGFNAWLCKCWSTPLSRLLWIIWRDLIDLFRWNHRSNAFSDTSFWRSSQIYQQQKGQHITCQDAAQKHSSP